MECLVKNRIIQKLSFLCFRAFCAVLGATLQTIGNTGGIKRTANDMVTYTGEVFYTTAAYHNDTVLLQVMTFSGDVGVNLLLVRQANTCHFSIAELGFLGVVV